MIIQMNTASVQSQVISFLRFPLVVFVLFIHSDFRGISSAWNPALLNTPFLHLASISLSLGNIIDFLSGSLAPLANPFFFFISGLLFFKGSDFSKKDYFDKLRSRTRSLLVPYVMWNAIFLVVLFVAEQLQPGWTSAIGKPIAQFGITDFLLSFWDISLICNQGGIAAPLDITMWFVRDLIILVILSPVIFWSLRWLSSFKKPIAIIVLCALLLAADHIPSVPGLNPQAFAFFGFGAYFGINKTDFTALFRPFLLGGLLFAIFFKQFGMYNLMYAALIVLSISLVTRTIQSGRHKQLPSILTDACFFVFAYHTLALGIIISLFKSGILNPSGNVQMAICYFFTPAVLFLVGALFHCILNRFFSSLLSLLTGGRSSS